MTSIEDRWLRLEPVKIGWHGMEWARFEREIRMAFDEAIEQRILDRRYEFLFEDNAGLPQGTAKGGLDSYLRLVDAGCLAVVGANYTDSALALTEAVDAAKVPLISWCGTERLQGEYCFRLGNGDCGGDAALVVGWLKRQGHERVAVINEISPNGEEYFRFFRQEARRRNVSHRGRGNRHPDPRQPRGEPRASSRQVRPDALVYMGYGMLAASGLLNEALNQLGWDPPRIMGTAFMFYLMGFEKFEGWVGIDQLDPGNPLVNGFHDRFVNRYGQSPPLWPNAIPVLAYDTARVLIEGLFRAPVLSGPGLKAGLEAIRFMPSTTGGPRTHIACSPYEHGMFRGDWLLYGKVSGGKLEFAGLFEPIG